MQSLATAFLTVIEVVPPEALLGTHADELYFLGLLSPEQFEIVLPTHIFDLLLLTQRSIFGEGKHRFGYHV